MRMLALAFAASLTFSTALSADGLNFEPARYAFLPELMMSKDEAVCRPFLAALTAAFKSGAYRIDLAGTRWPGADVHWIFPMPEADRGKFLLPEVPLADRTQVEALAIDLDHDGTEEILANIYWTFNWQGDWHALGLYRSREAFNRAMETGKNPEALFAQALPTGPNEGFLSGGKNVLSTWVENEAVMVNGSAYIVARGEVYGDDTVFGLVRINADASTSETCAVKALPGSQGPLQSGPVEEFVQLLAAVSGEEGAYGGTMHAQSQVLIDAGRAVARLAARPWVLGDTQVYNSRAVVDQDLDVWARSSLYTYRLRRAWPEKETAALAALTAFYRDQFGLTPEAAERIAASALDIVVRAYFVFPAGAMSALPDAPYRNLTQALLEGAPRARIESLLKPGDRYEDWGNIDEEPTLFYALENPVNVAVLLRSGGDPNVKGNFDKTALMYAAQFDLVDTAKILLAAGAEIDALTIQDGDFVQLNRYNRTALMYAAENASADMIRLLLARGANPKAEDTYQQSVLDYLGRNQKLSAEERAAIAAALAAAGAKPARP